MLIVSMTSLKRILDVKVYPWCMMGSPSGPSQQSTEEQMADGRKEVNKERESTERLKKRQAKKKWVSWWVPMILSISQEYFP